MCVDVLTSLCSRKTKQQSTPQLYGSGFARRYYYRSLLSCCINLADYQGDCVVPCHRMGLREHVE